MNRAARRAAKAAQPSWQRMSVDQRKAALVKNGITIDYVKRESDRAYDKGYTRGLSEAMKACYAAACLAAHDRYGFGRKRCIDLLRAIDDSIMYHLTSEDAMNEVLEKLGIELNFKEAIDRVQEVG